MGRSGERSTQSPDWKACALKGCELVRKNARADAADDGGGGSRHVVPDRSAGREGLWLDDAVDS